MAKGEFNKKSARDTVREILGLPPEPPPTAEEKAQMQRLLDHINFMRKRDPGFAMKDWVDAEAKADPDAFDTLTPNDMRRMLEKAGPRKPAGAKRAWRPK